MGDTREMLSVRDVIRRLGISRATLVRYRARRGFPEPHRLGGVTLRWDPREVDDWLTAQRRRAA